MFRFRSTDKLLGKHKELENQEIYFAAPDELNDPMEGFKDIVWNGDSIVWNNFFKHYALCLLTTYEMVLIASDSVTINEASIPVFRDFSNPITDEEGELINEITKATQSNQAIKKAISILVKRAPRVKNNEVLFYLKAIHHHIFVEIENALLKRGIVTKKPEFREQSKLANLVDGNLLNLDKLEKAIELNDSQSELSYSVIFSVLKNANLQMDLLHSYNTIGKNPRNNFLFILANFPESFLLRMEELIYPQWYTACFMSSCDNSSVWGHYGDNHRGMCLKFKTGDLADTPKLSLEGIIGQGTSGPIIGKRDYYFKKVNYDGKFCEIDFFRSLGRLSEPQIMRNWYQDESKSISVCSKEMKESQEEWVRLHWERFYQSSTYKLHDWSYENEYRIILSDILNHRQEKESRKLKYDFNDLDGIIFGIKTRKEDKLEVMRIVEEKCQKENRKEFKFYQCDYDSQKNKIIQERLSLLKRE